MKAIPINHSPLWHFNALLLQLFLNVLKGSSHQLLQASFFAKWNLNKQPFQEVFISEGAIPVIPLPFLETGLLLHALKYQACYVTRASFHFLLFSLAWGFPCFGFFLICSPMTFSNSAFSETDLKYGKKNVSAGCGEMEKRWWWGEF